MQAPVEETIADVLVHPSDPTLPYVDIALGGTGLRHQAWTLWRGSDVYFTVENGGVSQRFPHDGPGTPSYGPVAEFLRAAEALSARAKPFIHLILKFVSDLNRSPSPETVSHVVIEGQLLEPQVSIIVTGMDMDGGMLVFSKEQQTGALDLKEIGGRTRQLRAGDYSEALRSLLSEVRELQTAADAFA